MSNITAQIKLGEELKKGCTLPCGKVCDTAVYTKNAVRLHYKICKICREGNIGAVDNGDLSNTVLRPAIKDKGIKKLNVIKEKTAIV
jgi:hypothetical protein